MMQTMDHVKYILKVAAMVQAVSIKPKAVFARLTHQHLISATLKATVLTDLKTAMKLM